MKEDEFRNELFRLLDSGKDLNTITCFVLNTAPSLYVAVYKLSIMLKESYNKAHKLQCHIDWFRKERKKLISENERLAREVTVYRRLKNFDKRPLLLSTARILRNERLSMEYRQTIAFYCILDLTMELEGE